MPFLVGADGLLVLSGAMLPMLLRARRTRGKLLQGAGLDPVRSSPGWVYGVR